jgi:MFS transporter, DHA2 family, multidrug resistance protein
MDLARLLGLLGILVASMASEFNDQVTQIALADVRGGFAISRDPGTWIQSLYGSAQIVGMAISPWALVTFSLRRWTIFSIILCGVSSALIPLSPNIAAIYTLRILQGLAGGLIIPLLMTTALRVLSNPYLRIYGLAVYALTASFTASMATALAALWTDIVDWRFVFLQAIPLCTIAGTLVWFGEPQDEPQYERFRIFDWRGFLLLTAGFGAFSTMLYQGDRFDWFNSPTISVLALVSVVCIPLLILNEWFHPLPLIKLQLLGRRNIAYGFVALFTFLIISQAASTVPVRFLEQVQGYRPLQSAPVALLVAVPQILLLPAVAFLLDFPWADPRAVSVAGLALMLAACIGSAFADYTWMRDQFYPWQILQAIGQPMVVMSLLMLATNTVRGPDEAPFASALVNTPRAVSEAVGAWLVQLITRWRGSLHSERIIDQIGENRFALAEGLPNLRPPPTPFNPVGQVPASGLLHGLSGAVQQQVAVLTTGDTYLVLAGLTGLLMIVAALLPERTPPPRILMTQQQG